MGQTTDTPAAPATDGRRVLRFTHRMIAANRRELNRADIKASQGLVAAGALAISLFTALTCNSWSPDGGGPAAWSWWAGCVLWLLAVATLELALMPRLGPWRAARGSPAQPSPPAAAPKSLPAATPTLALTQTPTPTLTLALAPAPSRLTSAPAAALGSPPACALTSIPMQVTYFGDVYRHRRTGDVRPALALAAKQPLDVAIRELFWTSSTVMSKYRLVRVGLAALTGAVVLLVASVL